jgi:hypothetical protein
MVENKKNGRINRPAARLVNKFVLLSAEAMAVLTMVTNRAFLNKLSFSAPRNWVIKNGKNRRLVKR